MSKNCRTSDSALLMILGRLGLPDRLPFSKPKVNWLLHQPEITFAQFSELQLNRQKPELIQALFIFLSIYLVLQIFCSNFAAAK